MITTVLISQVPLPYASIGSWSTLYHNYLQTHHLIDVIVCPKPEYYYDDIEYSIVRKPSLVDKIKSKFFYRRKNEVIRALKKRIKNDEKYVFQLVDNYGMAKPLHDFLTRKGIRKQSYIQFFYHGFDPYEQPTSTENFYSVIDELVYLTNESREQFKNRIPNLPQYSSILHNGIDTQKFKVASATEISHIKNHLNIKAEKVFVWCSQDRPKKGLDIILEAWKEVFTNHKNIVLLVIGCEPKAPINGVRYLGKIPNVDLAQYYQISDCYLFPTLCNEGFGMSLIEALHCGCYCIASKLGGVPEVLHHGKYGLLINHPTNVSSWVNAITDFLSSDKSYPQIPTELYSMTTWNTEMNMIIQVAQQRLLQQ